MFLNLAMILNQPFSDNSSFSASGSDPFPLELDEAEEENRVRTAPSPSAGANRVALLAMDCTAVLVNFEAGPPSAEAPDPEPMALVSEERLKDGNKGDKESNFRFCHI